MVGLVVSWTAYQEVHGSNPGLGRNSEIWFEISAVPAPPGQLCYDEYTVSGKMRWLWERIGNPFTYAEAKKMKSLMLHSHGCPRASLRVCIPAVPAFLLHF